MGVGELARNARFHRGVAALDGEAAQQVLGAQHAVTRRGAPVVERLEVALERCGGVPAGYYLPTKFAGPMNSAVGMIDFPSLAAYEKYREKLGADPEATEVTRRVEASGAILNEDRSIVSRVPDSRR